LNDGFYNAPNYVNDQTFAILKADGSITTWGGLIYGTVAPTGSGYTKIYSNRYAFAALTTNGSIKAWGDWDWEGIFIRINLGIATAKRCVFATSIRATPRLD
jgi:hypothetical protein